MATRYNFTIHAKIRVGKLIGLSFCTGYFDDDASAVAFGIFLETVLANYAKVSVSKVIWESTSNEILTSHTITDTFDINVLMVNSSDTTKQKLLTLPGITPGSSISALGTKNIYNENGELMDSVFKTDIIAKNVIEGGPV